MRVREQMLTILTEALQASRVEVVDESARHAGHAGARPEGETHFRVLVVAERFRGASRIARHRMVNDALAGLLATRIHALSITAMAPEEAVDLATTGGREAEA
jgi:BolA protein